ncbi:MAG: fasciclin domain-containing protein [Caldilineaceae bacterium]|nr:fasciclin domain-containing protein [Caldilineaceae bacterium]
MVCITFAQSVHPTLYKGDKRMIRLALSALLALAFFVGLIATPASAQSADIVDTAVEAGNFETLVTAVSAAGLVEALKSEGPFTVFAPTDEAFAALPAGTVEALLADPEGDLTQILLFHVVPGKVLAADISDGLEAETLQGATLTFTVGDDGSVMVNDVPVIATDIEGANGVIHVIDSVLLPPAEMAEPEVEAAEESQVAMAMDEPMMADIVDTAVEAGSFGTLIAAVQAAGLEEALRGEGPFTVFAPTDEAFATLPEGTIEALLADPTGDLAQILLYHVVSGKVMAGDVTDGLEAATLQGATVAFTVGADGSVKINDAAIIATDIESANGVIHVIDAVLLPPAEMAEPKVEAEMEAPKASTAPEMNTQSDQKRMKQHHGSERQGERHHQPHRQQWQQGPSGNRCGS